MTMETSRGSRLLTRSMDILAFIAAVLAVAFLARDGSPVRQYLSLRLEERATKSSVRTNWETLRQQSTLLDSSLGPASMIVFSDFECPYCRASAAMMDSLLDRGISIAYYHTPSSARPSGVWAAKVSICAEESGLWEDAYERLMRSDEWLSLEREVALQFLFPTARGLGECVQSIRVAEVLEFRRALAAESGLRGTPVFASRGGLLFGKPASAASLEHLAGRQ